MVFPIRRNRVAKDDPYDGEFWEHACNEGNSDARQIRTLGYKWFSVVVPPK